MGGGSSVLKQEVTKPFDASDVDTPRGVSAKLELSRLRTLLFANISAIRAMEGTLSVDSEAELKKPLDASDVQEGQGAVREVSRLRHIIAAKFATAQRIMLDLMCSEGDDVCATLREGLQLNDKSNDEMSQTSAVADLEADGKTDSNGRGGRGHVPERSCKYEPMDVENGKSGSINSAELEHFDAQIKEEMVRECDEYEHAQQNTLANIPDEYELFFRNSIKIK
uniref:Uncharacterized protein n=1 Tax=Octactis speculum TaxID=3111310 RepID=A0A7S2F643_9STRA|mmetsp:Transcript_15399/g.20684  ORF Transcript_15399/g.20684 Transcript_15399/m.20684 type:complete len:224 (+) Transcript_15399:90-761(+)